MDYTGGVVSFIHNDKNLLKCDVVILDEMSMVDVKLFQALIAALRYSCRIIMVGDADQLPSVGPGNILGETIRSGLVPTVCLNEIFRQAAQSLIVENAHHIISGEPLKKGGKTDDFFFLEADGDAAQKLVCDLVTTRLPRSYQFDPVKDIQVLCPTKLGPTGTQALNAELQALLNPPKKGKPELQSAARVFRVGDKVMQVRNNYEITWQRIGGEQGVGAYNGDIGIVESIDVRSRSMVVRMDDRRLVYPAENLNELEIAYAITVHKSQGSEFPAVILPAAQVPPRLCYRNLLLYRRHPRAEALHRGGPAGRGEPDDVQHPPEPALQRPCLSFAGRAAAGTDGSRITPSVTFGDSSLGEGASGEEEKLSAVPKPPSGRQTSPAGTDSPAPGRNVTTGDKERNRCHVSDKKGNRWMRTK